MNLTKYQRQKELRKEEEFQPRIVCYTCFRPDSYCQCSEIEEIDSEVEIVILMHPKEAYKEKLGTGRIAQAFLKNSRLLIGVDFKENVEFQQLIQDQTKSNMVLYPGESAVSLEDSDHLKEGLEKPLRLFVIDGTWPCARKMMNQNPLLKKLPRVSFREEYLSRFLIKQQPGKQCLSTLESIHQFLLLWEGRDHQQMLNALDQLVQVHLEIASDPDRPGYRKKPYKTVGERKIQRRKRKIFA